VHTKSPLISHPPFGPRPEEPIIEGRQEALIHETGYLLNINQTFRLDQQSEERDGRVDPNA
jgi:hypothetical protein